MEIRINDLSGPEIKALLETHLQEMASHSPPESCHALDLDGLKVPEITFWTVWEDDELNGCGALKDIGAGHGEIKSMHVPARHRGKGVSVFLLEHILKSAQDMNLTHLSLETGSMSAFIAARKLYEKHGFVECEPFGDYSPDPNSMFMTLKL